MKFSLVFHAALLLFTLPVISQDAAVIRKNAETYDQTIFSRSKKIVDALSIADSSQAIRLIEIVSDEYKNLNNIYSLRDVLVKMNKENSGSLQNDSIKNELSKIIAVTSFKTDSLHKIYISKLTKNLNAQQVDQLKDGMTYGIVKVTYNGYNQMIQTLTEVQKKQIMLWLVEARELAMDAESSEKKHACFGKYKGRINNYLSAAGYDLKKEGEDWQKRIKAAADQNKPLQ